MKPKLLSWCYLGLQTPTEDRIQTLFILLTRIGVDSPNWLPLEDMSSPWSQTLSSPIFFRLATSHWIYLSGSCRQALVAPEFIEPLSQRRKGTSLEKAEEDLCAVLGSRGQKIGIFPEERKRKKRSWAEKKLWPLQWLSYLHNSLLMDSPSLSWVNRSPRELLEGEPPFSQ